VYITSDWSDHGIIPIIDIWYRHSCILVYNIIIKVFLLVNISTQSFFVVFCCNSKRWASGYVNLIKIYLIYFRLFFVISMKTNGEFCIFVLDFKILNIMYRNNCMDLKFKIIFKCSLWFVKLWLQNDSIVKNIVNFSTEQKNVVDKWVPLCCTVVV